MSSKQFTAADEKAETPRQLLRYRDEWIADVLSDLELSPTARVVGASLGLAVNLNNWPTIPASAYGGHLRKLAARLGLPLAIVVKACNALVGRGRLRIWCGPEYVLRGFDLTDDPSLRRDGGQP